jgi:predicted glutamine amidotransferase
MCRLLGYCASHDVPVAQLLGADGFGEFTGLAALHCDGWGMAWYEDGQPRLRKSQQSAEDDPEYAKLAHEPAGDLGLVHLRWATPGLEISERNSHPFAHGPYQLAHNGAIHPQSRLGEIIPDGWASRLTGTTDSEHYFLGIMARLEASGGDLPAAVAGTLAFIESEFAPASLNAILLAPDRLYAINWHDPAKVAEADLRKRGWQGGPAEVLAYLDLRYRVRDDAVVVSSTGWPQDGWELLPNHHLMTVERGTLRRTVQPLR